MSPRRSLLTAAALVLLPLLAACAEEVVPGPPADAVARSVAWTAETAAGLRLVAEPLLEPALSEASQWSEHQLVERELGLPGEELFQLHLVGDAAALRGSGELRTPAGGRLTGLGEPPAGLSPRARSLWLVRAGSEALPGAGPARRSFLLRGEPPTAAPSLTWTRDEEEVELQRREWTGKERMAFLDPVAAAAAGPELPPDHPPVDPGVADTDAVEEGRP